MSGAVQIVGGAGCVGGNGPGAFLDSRVTCDKLGPKDCDPTLAAAARPPAA